MDLLCRDGLAQALEGVEVSIMRRPILPLDRMAERDIEWAKLRMTEKFCGPASGRRAAGDLVSSTALWRGIGRGSPWGGQLVSGYCGNPYCARNWRLNDWRTVGRRVGCRGDSVTAA
jgi:hypothetical protein